MSLRLKIAIGILSLLVATIVVLGDSVLHDALGFPRYLGRAFFLIALTLGIALWLGWQWLADRAREKRAASGKPGRQDKA